MKRLMITVDVEAQPGRAERDHVDRLIWGKYPAGRAGIGEMMDIADKYGVKLTMFLDYCEEHLYGEALLDVGREIQRRGHDLQLHAHLDFLKRDFWATHAIPAETSLNELNSAQAEAAIGFLCDRHHHVSGREALAFRGGGYRYNGALLAAMVRHGVILDSSVNVSRPTQPIQLSPSKQFLWSSGCLEIPISCVAGYRGLGYLFDFNFNSGYFNNAAQMLDCLDLFYQEQGDEAVAVLVMHSWAFLKLTDKKYFTEIVPSQIEKFDAFLNLIAGQYQVVTATDIVALHAQNEIKLDPTQDFARLAERKQPTPTDAAPTIPGSTALSALVSEKDECPICGAAVARFIDMNGRRCPDCGSLERQRCFAIAYDQEIRQACDVAGKNVLIFSPSVSELRFLKAQGVAQATSVDIRPESKPDIIADVCAMPQIASGSQSVVFASYLMSCVYDMEAALDGIARILAPDGVYVSIETLRSSQPTIETTELAKITGHYGYDLYEKYKVGSFRVLGEDDYLATLLKKFSVSRFFATDPITGQLNIVHLCRPIDAGKAQMNITDNQFESNDAAFAEYMANTPDGTYAKFSVGNQVRAVQRGYRHPTLGKNLKRFDDFWEAGTSNFERYQYLLKFEKNQRFVDYGCGSLRLGAHFIRYLDPEGYFGLDVMTEFIEMGKENVGEALLLEKKPCFGPIDEHSLAKATEFCADIIISTSCAFQVHPDEKRRYIEDLKRLACKSTSIVCFDSKIAKEHFRYQSSAWVWTLDFYREAFSPMVLLATHKISEHNETGRDFEGMVLIFGHGSRDSVPEDLPKVLTKEQTPKGEQQESPIDESFAKLMRLEIEPTFAKTARPIRLLAHTPLSRAQKRIVEGFASTLPTVLDSWRSLADPVLARQAVELSGHKDESVDLFVSSDTLDFVADIEGTIKSIARVLRPGGAVVLRLKASRIANGAEPPTVAYQVDPRSVGLASGTSLPSMRVGREWILGAMTNAGLVAQHFRYAISKDGHEEWFLGRKQINDILAEFPAPGTTISTTCDICGSELTGLSEGDTGCPECKSRPRTRTLVKVSEVVSKALASSRTEEKSLLAFAMNGAEERVLAPQFNHIKSASLYGNYRTGHETGVDVRDLSRYKAASFDGVFGILLFDYFEEHEIALREIVRVLKPGGVLFTHIAPYRLADNQEEPPKNTSTIKKREGYFEYVPDDANMPSIRVGANWFMAAMRRAGLEGKQVEVIDSPTGERLVWFIGIKPKTLAGATCELVQQPFIRSKNVAHEYFQFPSGKIVYYRNVRSGLGSVLQAIDSLAVAEGVYPEPLSNTFVRGVRDRFRIKEKDIPESVLTFTIVRNPFRRLAAVFDYGIGRRRFFATETTDHLPYVQFGFSESTDFGTFVRSVVTIPPDLSDDYITPQSHRLFDEHGKRTKFIARLEDILEDWAVLMRLYGADIPLPRRNVSKNNPVYWTEELRQLVYDYYLDDFRIFGYEADSVTIDRAEDSAIPFKAAPYHFDEAFAAQCARQFLSDNEAVRAEARLAESSRTTVVVSEPRMREDTSSLPKKEYSVPLPSDTGFKRVTLRLSAPPVPKELDACDFAEHVMNPVTGKSTDQVIVCSRGLIGVSDDLGLSWRTIKPVAAEGFRLWNCFTRADGGHIVQSQGWQGPNDTEKDPEKHAAIFVFDKDWQIEGGAKPGNGYWHGSASVGQSGDTIMYAEYYNNSERYMPDFNERKDEYLKTLRPNAVFRSRNGGLSWTKVFEMPPMAMRHFHTIQPDPFVPQQWWLSSGDMADETHVWRSDDDGDNWIDVTNPAPEIDVPKSYADMKRACQRYTDVIISEDSLLWGADDLMGFPADANPELALKERGGARLYVSPKSGMLQPRAIGYLGNPARSIIDAGPAWIILTEAKKIEIGLRPSVFLLFKTNHRLIHLLDVDNYMGRATGFSYSRASRKSKDGVFFSYRGTYDAFSRYAHVLKWQIEFE